MSHRQGFIRHMLLRLAVSFVLITLLYSVPAQAMSVMLGPWQGLVYEAQFIGLVRCVRGEYTDGSKAYGYNNVFYDVEVLRPLKGEKEGARFTVSAGTDAPMVDLYPKAETGKSYVLILVKEYSPEGEKPKPPASYQQMWPGLIPHDPSDESTWLLIAQKFVQTPHAPKDYEAFEVAAKSFMKLPADEQAFIVMKETTLSRLRDMNHIEGADQWIEPVAKVKNTKELVAVLLKIANIHMLNSTVTEILRLGRSECLAALEAAGEKAKQSLGRSYERVMEGLRWRVGQE